MRPKIWPTAKNKKKGYPKDLASLLKVLLAQKSSKQKAFEYDVSLFLGIVIKYFGNRLKPTSGYNKKSLL